MPSDPLTSTKGMMGQYHSGSIFWLSSYRWCNIGSSDAWNNVRARGLKYIGQGQLEVKRTLHCFHTTNSVFIAASTVRNSLVRDWLVRDWLICDWLVRDWLVYDWLVRDWLVRDIRFKIKSVNYDQLDFNFIFSLSISKIQFSISFVVQIQNFWRVLKSITTLSFNKFPQIWLTFPESCRQDKGGTGFTKVSYVSDTVPKHTNGFQ